MIARKARTAQRPAVVRTVGAVPGEAAGKAAVRPGLQPTGIAARRGRQAGQGAVGRTIATGFGVGRNRLA
jgi:hypothetical protein